MTEDMREQARLNAGVAVRNAEEDPQVAATLAIAYALLDVAAAIREVGDAIERKEER